MDVLFVVGPDKKHDNLELRWALRSIERYGNNLGDVVVAGYPPDWLNKKTVKTLKVPDIFDVQRKHDNILNCILSAIDTGLVHGEFLYSSDDHFFVAPVDLDNYPYWYDGDAHKLVDNSDPKINGWYKSVSDTRRLLEKEGLSIKVFNCHLNTHMHTDDAPRVRELVAIGRGMGLGILNGFEPTCLFMAARTARQQISLTKVDDCKLGACPDFSYLLNILSRRTVFSVSDELVDNADFKSVVSLMYMNKSRFEE